LYNERPPEWQRYNRACFAARSRFQRMRLVSADGPLLEQILDLTHAIWGEGLNRTAYAQWNAAQLRTRWGREHLQRFALIDDQGRVLATAKRYRFEARLDGRTGNVAGIAAVFTPPDRRGRGHATSLIEELIAQEQRAGAMAAVLFSEIGAAFYERLGFLAVPLDEVTVNVERKGGSPAMLVRAGDERDLPALALMNDLRSAEARFALRRTVPLIQYAIAKKRLQAGLGPEGLRQLEFFVAEEGANAVAYAVLSVSKNGWTLEEAGDRDPAAARLGAMLQVLAAREPSRQAPLIRTWWPRSFVVPPQWKLSDRIDSRDLLMVRSFAELSRPLTADDLFYWHSDHF
jgi:GNAT superfamily N-acetyltransferase